jgi:hypothetical protein
MLVSQLPRQPVAMVVPTELHGDEQCFECLEPADMHTVVQIHECHQYIAVDRVPVVHTHAYT